MGSDNPLFLNDPVLVLISRWLHLTPIFLLYTTFLLLPGALLLWSGYNRTFRIKPSQTNPNGHGFLSFVNCYLVIIPFLNYAIFDYYNYYLAQIETAFSTHRVSGSLDDFFAPFAGPWAKALTFVGYAAGLTLALIATRWPQKSRHTTWLHQRGRPRLIAYYFYFLFFGVQMAIVFNWILRHVLIWLLLNNRLDGASLHPFHADRMFGLGFLGDLTWYSFEVVFLISLFVVVWLAGARLTFQQRPLFKHPGHVATLATVLVLAPVAVLVPLNTAHDLMANAKIESVGKLSEANAGLLEELERTLLAKDSTAAETSVARLEAFDRWYERLASNSVWPISGVTYTSALIVGFLNPIIIALLVEMGNSLVMRWREKQAR